MSTAIPHSLSHSSLSSWRRRAFTSILIGLLCGHALAGHAEMQQQVYPLTSPAAPGSLAPRLSLGADGTVWLSWLESVAPRTAAESTQKRTAKTDYALKISAYRDGEFGPAIEVSRGSDWVANWADTPHLFVGREGWMVAQWLQKGSGNSYAYDVMLSQSQDGGQHWSAAFSPHDDGSASEHGFVSFFALADSAAHKQQVGLVWLDGRQTVNDGPMSLRSASLDRDGHWQGQQALDMQVCDCCQTGATATATGPVAVYRNRDDAEIRDIYLVKQIAAEASGETRWSEPLRVHADDWKITGCPVNGPQVVSLGEEVAVLWYSMADSFGSVQLARSQEHISRFNPPFILARDTPLGRVGLSALAKQELALTWIEELPHQHQLQLAWLEPDEHTPSGYHERQRLTVASVPGGRASGFPSLQSLPGTAGSGTTDSAAENQGSSVLLSWTAQQEDQLQVQVALILPPAVAAPEAGSGLGSGAEVP